MENPDAGPSNSGKSPMRESPNLIDELHPVLRRLIERMIDLPERHEAALTKRHLARAVECAIAMMPDDEQAYLVSHIMTDDDITQETFDSQDIEDLDQVVLFSAVEKEFLLRTTPEPDSDESDSGGERYGNRGTCKICLMDSDSILLTCGCHYCSSCLRWTIRLGLQTIHDFPPHCCFDFGENLIRAVDRPGLVHLYRQLAAEKATPLHDRLYCFDTRCSALIPAWLIEAAIGDDGGSSGVGTCPLCDEETCVACRGKSHRGLPCGDNKEDEEAVLDRMDNEGLIYCPGCGMMLAFDGGCNLMRCICGKQFCFTCGQQWRKCQCFIKQADGIVPPMIPNRERPGVRPIDRSGLGHLSEPTFQIPRLKCDSDSEAKLMAIVNDLVPPVKKPVLLSLATLAEWPREKSGVVSGAHKGVQPGVQPEIRMQSPFQVRLESPFQIRGQSPFQIRGQSPFQIRGTQLSVQPDLLLEAQPEARLPFEIEGRLPFQTEGRLPSQTEGRLPFQPEGRPEGQATIQRHLRLLQQQLLQLQELQEQQEQQQQLQQDLLEQLLEELEPQQQQLQQQQQPRQQQLQELQLQELQLQEMQLRQQQLRQQQLSQLQLQELQLQQQRLQQQRFQQQQPTAATALAVPAVLSTSSATSTDEHGNAKQHES